MKMKLVSLKNIATLFLLLQSTLSLAMVIPTIQHQYCLSFGSNTLETLTHMASTLLDFGSYKQFDGKGAHYQVLGFPMTPFDLYASVEVPNARQINSSVPFPENNVQTSAVFAIQPVPKQWAVAGQYYPKLKMDCQTTLEQSTAGTLFSYTCQIDLNYKHNYGLERFDTVMQAQENSPYCQSNQVYLEVVGNITVSDRDFPEMKAGIISGMPGNLRLLGNIFFDAFFDVPKLFTNFYDSFYGGWITQSEFKVNKHW